MKTAGVIGWPIAHSKSPLIHRFWLQALGLDGDYSRFAVRPDQVGRALKALPALGLSGVNVTVPHKLAVMAHLDRIEHDALAIGAVNTVVVEDGRLVGANTDMAGFLEPLHGLPLGCAAVIGAGGAARAILLGLKRHGVKHVTLMNRSVDRAAALLDSLGVAGHAVPLETPLPVVDLLVNASSLGMHGQPPLRLDLSGMPTGGIVYDIVYTPLETELLKAARARGLRAIDGLEMLIGQAAIAFDRFFGAPPPRGRDTELKTLLTGGQG